MPIDWTQFGAFVSAHQRFWLTSHVKPDCDALGSELGLAGVLESLGKEVTIVNADAVPRHLTFIDPANRIQQWTPALGAGAGVDAMIVVDTGSWSQLGVMGDVLKKSSAAKAVIDHHVSSDDLGGLVFKDSESDSTGRLIYQAAEALNVRITAEIATALFAAMATDTGWFRFNSTQPVTYRVAAALVEAGASPSAIYNRLYEQDRVARIKLAGRILQRTETDLDGRLIWSAALAEDFAATDALPAETEDVINRLLTVAGTEVALLFVQTAEDRFKVSFRSRGKVDVSRIAEQFAGGGHKAAAGASATGTYANVRERMLDAVRQSMR